MNILSSQDITMQKTRNISLKLQYHLKTVEEGSEQFNIFFNLQSDVCAGKT